MYSKCTKCFFVHCHQTFSCLKIPIDLLFFATWPYYCTCLAAGVPARRPVAAGDGQNGHFRCFLRSLHHRFHLELFRHRSLALPLGGEVQVGGEEKNGGEWRDQSQPAQTDRAEDLRVVLHHEHHDGVHGIQADAEAHPQEDESENVPQPLPDAGRPETGNAAGKGAVEESDGEEPGGEVERRV